VGKIGKKQSEIQCHIVKNTLLQAVFFGDFPNGKEALREGIITHQKQTKIT